MERAELREPPCGRPPLWRRGDDRRSIARVVTAPAANYAWNVLLFAVVVAIVSPAVTWSALRRAPLWRTVVEPLVGAVAGMTLGVVLGSGIVIV